MELNDKNVYGANSILAVSLASLRASSIHLKVPLYKRINDLYYQLTGTEEEITLPNPMLNILKWWSSC